ncbi:MAG: lamin tail domain-containing protein [Patescibacteria group bacterium]
MTEEEWIEIFNGSEFITDISGWQLDDSASSSKAFTFPENTLIAPKSYLVFSRPITKITLNNDIDSVKLLMPGGILFQEIKYEKPPQGKSSARTEEGFVWSDPTPGLPNISGIAINSDKQTISQLDIVEPQITKNSTKTYSINLTENEIEGGYTTINPNDPASAPSNGASAGKQNSKNNTNELASIKQSSQNPLNLVLIIIAIVFGMGFLGLLLVKFRKRGLPIG